MHVLRRRGLEVERVQRGVVRLVRYVGEGGDPPDHGVTQLGCRDGEPVAVPEPVRHGGDELVRRPLGCRMDRGGERRPGGGVHDLIGDVGPEVLGKQRCPRRAQVVRGLSGGAQCGWSEVADDAPPQRVGRNLGRQRSRLGEGCLDQVRHVEASTVESVEVVGQHAAVRIGRDLLRQELVPPALPTPGGCAAKAVVEIVLVAPGVSSKLARTGGSGVVVGDGVGSAPDRQVTAEVRVLGIGERLCPFGCSGQGPVGCLGADLIGEGNDATRSGPEVVAPIR